MLVRDGVVTWGPKDSSVTILTKSGRFITLKNINEKTRFKYPEINLGMNGESFFIMESALLRTRVQFALIENYE